MMDADPGYTVERWRTTPSGRHVVTAVDLHGQRIHVTLPHATSDAGHAHTAIVAALGTIPDDVEWNE